MKSIFLLLDRIEISTISKRPDEREIIDARTDSVAVFAGSKRTQRVDCLGVPPATMSEFT